MLKPPASSGSASAPLVGMPLLTLVLILWLRASLGAADHRTPCSIGGIFSSNTTASEFHSAVQRLSSTRLSCRSHATAMSDSPLVAALRVSRHLIPNKVHAIVMSSGGSSSAAAAAVSHAGGIYSVPVIGISSRDPAFSDKMVFPSFLRTRPPLSHQADAWVRLLCHLAFTHVVLIHSADASGRAALGRFLAAPGCGGRRTRADVALPQIEAVIAFQPGLDSLRRELMDVKALPTRVYVLYSSGADAEVIFRDAAEVVPGAVWVASEGALDVAPAGTLGLRLANDADDAPHIKDAVWALATALGHVGDARDASSAPYNASGSLLYRALMNVSFDGETGRVSFDENGDRAHAAYDVVNVRVTGGEAARVGTLSFSAEKNKMELQLIEEKILWPGNSHKKPLGFIKSTHLRIVAIDEQPFVHARRVSGAAPPALGTRGGGAAVSRGCGVDEDPCPRSAESIKEDYCCKGYCVDLLRKLSKKLNFTYSLSLTQDGNYGSYVTRNISAGGRRRKQWTGMIGDLVSDRADMAVAPLTIAPERSEFIEFSKPFKYHGITILERKPSRSSTLVSFLQPFDNTLWILVLASIHVVALVVYLLDRFSPFSRYKSAPPVPDAAATGAAPKRSSCTSIPKPVDAHTEEDALNLSSSIWFAWGVLLNSGIGEGTPRSFSAKVLGIVWAAFAVMIVASYTANLAAFLVLERPYAKPTGLQDAILLSHFGNLSSATVRGSAVEMFFQRQVELARLYDDMAILNYNDAGEAVQDVKNGKLKAFIWDSWRLEFEAAMDCELVTTGELFGHSGYGIGLRKDSPWTAAVNIAILEMHEGGYMELLDKKWFPHLSAEAPGILCDGIQPGEKTPTALGLKNMAGVFILVLAGIFGGAALLVIEVTYKRHHARAQYRRELARYAFDKWRRVIVKRRFIRAAIAAQKQKKQLASIGSESTALRSPLPQEWTFGTLIPSSVGNVGSMAAAAAKVDLIQQMSPRVENIDSLESFDDIFRDDSPPPPTSPPPPPTNDSRFSERLACP